jgi:hypothetical protein
MPGFFAWVSEVALGFGPVMRATLVLLNSYRLLAAVSQYAKLVLTLDLCSGLSYGMHLSSIRAQPSGFNEISHLPMTAGLYRASMRCRFAQ